MGWSHNKVTVKASITLTIPAGKTLTVNGDGNALGEIMPDSIYGSMVIGGNTLTVTGGGTLIVKGQNGAEGDAGGAGAYATGDEGAGGQGGQGGAGGDGGTPEFDDGEPVGEYGGPGAPGAGGQGGAGGIGIDGTVTVNGGSATVNGGQGGAKGKKGDGNDDANAQNGSSGRAATGTITGKIQESADNSTWSVVSGTSSDKQYVKVTPNHNHSFTYSVSGATITATCGTANCPLTDSKATLTIVAPTMTAYGQTGDGISASAPLTGLTDFNTATGKTIAATDIKYVGRDGTLYEENATAPTNAGKYTAKITVEEKTARVDYEITKADPTTPTDLTATYGQTLADVTLSSGWAWADSTQSVGNVGDNTFKANYTPEDVANYYSKVDVDVTVTVGKATNPATVTDTASVTKGGYTVDLKNNVTLNGATDNVSYAIAGEANGCTLSGSTLTSGDTAGTVTVNVTVAEDDNYNASAAMPITVTISDKQTQTITASDVTVTYGDTDKRISATTDGGGTLSYAVKDGSVDYIDVDASTGALTIKKVGTATVVVTAAETGTYAQATKEVTVTINKASARPRKILCNRHSSTV